jgi:adenylate kinase
MRLVLLGAPGSGKGTQAKQVSQKFGLPHISTGDILREAARNGTALGTEAKSYMDKGELVPDRLMLDLIKERMGQPDAGQGFLLDGFPRTVVQAQSLEQMLKKQDRPLDLACYLEVERQELVKRLTARRLCTGCGAIYNLAFQTPRSEGKCDKCGAALEQRADDLEQTVENRLQVYRQQTEPLLDFYRSRGLLQTVNGGAAPDQVFTALSALLNGKR